VAGKAAQKESRTARRARLLEDARGVRVADAYDVCVVGGGAAGLVAAITAAEAGAAVVVLERDLECGRTILATGNGRCNLANRGLAPIVYNDPAFVEATCGWTLLTDVLAFFDDCGLATCEEDDRIYPRSLQAASVRNVLLSRARRADVTLACGRAVTNVRMTGAGAEVLYTDPGETDGPSRTLSCGAVIVASGGGVAPVAALGLATTPLSPVLCPLTCEPSPFLMLDGRRLRARATLLHNGQPEYAAPGEVLIRDYGLSGIVIFDISRLATPGDVIELDLLHNVPEGEARRAAQAAGSLDGLLDPQVAAVLMHEAGSLDAALELARALPFRVVGPAPKQQSQVTRGGLATSEFDPCTLQCRARAALLACGEALDVDGPCGGFNLSWAWKSGMVAGASAARVAGVTA